jgi:hypothetical protein
MIDVSTLSRKELLALHVNGEELRERGITRSSNNPTGDLAEYIFCKAFGWTLPQIEMRISMLSMRKTFDTRSRRGTRHAITTLVNSAIRNLSGRHFHFLAGAVFTQINEVLRAAIIPFSIVESRATFVHHTNSHRLNLHDDVWKADDVRDVTDLLRSVGY